MKWWIGFLSLFPLALFGQVKNWPLDRESVNVVQKVLPSVVTIYVLPKGQKEVIPDVRKRNYGAGVIVEANGLILTCLELVRQKDIQIVVFLSNGKKFFARRVGRDEKLGLALLKIPAKNLTPIAFGKSKGLSPGTFVFKFGNAFQTATDYLPAINFGTLSGVDKKRGIELFRTDCGVNPGDFGGPLVDVQGRLIGILIPSWVDPGTNTYVSYAVPLHLFRNRLKEMRGYLGVLLTLSSQGTQGALVEAVDPEGPAARAGLKAGDWIIQVGQTPVGNTNELAKILDQHTAGDKLVLIVRRNGKLMRFVVILGEKTLD